MISLSRGIPLIVEIESTKVLSHAMCNARYAPLLFSELILKSYQSSGRRYKAPRGASSNHKLLWSGHNPAELFLKWMMVLSQAAQDGVRVLDSPIKFQRADPVSPEEDFQ